MSWALLELLELLGVPGGWRGGKLLMSKGLRSMEGPPVGRGTRGMSWTTLRGMSREGVGAGWMGVSVLAGVGGVGCSLGKLIVGLVRLVGLCGLSQN